MSLAWYQINPIDVNFHFWKSFETFNKKNQLTKSHPKRTRAWKVPCLLPIRVKCPFITCCPSQILKPSYGPAFRWWPGLEFADFTSLHLHFQFSWTSANSWEGFFFLGQLKKKIPHYLMTSSNRMIFTQVVLSTFV